MTPSPDPAPLLTGAARKDAWRAFLWKDHAILRRLLPNAAEIGPGVIRRSQPEPRDIRSLQEKGLSRVITLRGENPGQPFYDFEHEVCEALGIDFHVFDFFPGGPPVATDLLRFLDLVTTASGSVMFHCKTGADRTGLAAAMYVLASSGNDIAAARRQLSWKFFHVRTRRMGIFDYVIDRFEKDHLATGIDVLDWIATLYDPAAFQREYEAGFKGR